MNAQMQAAWRKMVGTALLWVAFAALISISSIGGGERSVRRGSAGVGEVVRQEADPGRAEHRVVALRHHVVAATNDEPAAVRDEPFEPVHEVG